MASAVQGQEWPGISSLSAALSLLILAALVATASRALAQGVVGSITSLDGVAKLVRSGRESPVTQGMKIETNDKLVTQRGGNLTVTFGDHSSLELGEASSIVINQGIANSGSSDLSAVGLLGGHLRSIINVGLRGVAPRFEVRSPNAVAGVRGTDFKTAYIEGKPCPGFPTCLRYTDVGVYKGRVEVTNPLNPKAAPVIVTGGRETTVPCEEPPATPSPLGMGEMMAPAYR